MELIDSIKVIVEHPTLTDFNESMWLTDSDTLKSFPDDFQDAVLGLTVVCNAYLITDSGGLETKYTEALRAVGCRVGPGEQDSFGLLTAILYTPKGKVLFG
jgi:hypothetical protein